MTPAEGQSAAGSLESRLLKNLDELNQKIRKALAAAGSPDRLVTLIAVSKKQPLEKIDALARAGHLNFGENYVQEALPKMEKLAHQDLKWHFIGGLQSNKAKYVSGRFSLIHSVDSEKLAQGLHNKAKSLDIIQPVLIQVNLAGESQKSGTSPGQLPDLAEKILAMNHLRLEGLMTMPPFFDDPERSRPYFAALRSERDLLKKRLGVKLPHLSMGMSGDFEAAIKEGATLIRLGTALFGPRPECKVQG
ncbi:YggS family pyridoxal phosphate-dependent enzyme [Desulfonatronovibrio hydrogenovorans]|uniref:YggS family pyridoxal phosphate-dependent enzyme n=1 Tax=Desulfonatronovibrio hydrogenovorans TaxID=53245 RepID=UPI000558A4BD|nr:YggS family pyridoxal phosphate-dependent enzyme [Desulfonatronovibrio hydrogenovorans]